MVDNVEYFFCRVVEVKMLLFNIVYKRAKLQLMNVKRDRLLVSSLAHQYWYLAALTIGDTNFRYSQKKAQQLSSGLQETQMIKNSMLCSAQGGPVDIQADDSHINTRLFNSQGKCQVWFCVFLKMTL